MRTRTQLGERGDGGGDEGSPGTDTWVDTDTDTDVDADDDDPYELWSGHGPD